MHNKAAGNRKNDGQAATKSFDWYSRAREWHSVSGKKRDAYTAPTTEALKSSRYERFSAIPDEQ